MKYHSRYGPQISEENEVFQIGVVSNQYIMFQTTLASFHLGMDSSALHLAHNEFETKTKVAFSELRKDQTFTDVQLVCEEDSGGTAVTSAHKAILAASSPFFNNVLRGLTHPKPLLYLKDIPKK